MSASSANGTTRAAPLGTVVRLAVSAAAGLWAWIRWGARWLGFLLLFGGVIPFALAYLLFSTDRDRQYRDLHPGLMAACRDGLASGWDILAKHRNQELSAIREDKAWAERLRCSLQRHVVPGVNAAVKPLDYHLAFLEFKENGEPYLLNTWAGGKPVPLAPSDLQQLASGAEYPATSQLDVLKQHLRLGKHYVIVFAHGWRHDARVGDGNVADLRHHAAHAARILAARCEVDPAYCDMKVTAVYAGWRGARIDEDKVVGWFGKYLGENLTTFATATTLFDRKPVAEQIAPSVISAIRAIERVVLQGKDNRIMVMGHSLGGNILATGLRDDVVKAVRRHKPGEIMPPVLGDLVVLINPAAEASKWTAIQREVWSRVAYFLSATTSWKDLEDGHRFFNERQKPVVISMTAAAAFPAGGLRDADCLWIASDLDDSRARTRNAVRKAIEANKGLFVSGIAYDTATHWLFPALKFDFRPASQWLDREVARIEGRLPQRHTCDQTAGATVWGRVTSAPYRLLSKLLREFPFQSTDREETRTIGHLNPVRPADDVLVNKVRVSAAPFGTTHEIYGVKRPGHLAIIPYEGIAGAAFECPRVDSWLIRARRERSPFGSNWDSSYLQRLPGRASAPLADRPGAHIVHGFIHGGQQPITKANDPFWNMRAFDNILAQHNGFTSGSFICAVNQLVLDDITGVEAPPNAVPDPTR